jgi:hypothetical protein
VHGGGRGSFDHRAVWVKSHLPERANRERFGEGATRSLCWWDPKGGEWRWHEVDRSHPAAHWDHNPWITWNSEWTHINP